jgi:hypothetical protein
MPILFSTEFNLSQDKIDEMGLFDALIDTDNHFFINIKCLQKTKVPEFKDAYEKINRYFEKICKLLMSSKTRWDRHYKAAYNLFDFPEVNGINLGFSSGTHGAGFGKRLRKQIIQDADEIIKSGTSDPEIFHLIGLFEEKVGPDRLSDMLARIIESNIVAYSIRVYNELGINSSNYPDYSFANGILINPYKRGIKLLLLPFDILHKLPIARDWDDIERVCRENEAIKKEINELIGNDWKRITASRKKAYLREWVFKKPERVCNIIDSYKKSEVEPFNPYLDLDYLSGVLKNKYSVKAFESRNSYEASVEIIENYRKWIENNKGWVVVQEVNSQKRETCVQLTFMAIAEVCSKMCNLDLSPEVDSGRGPLDFKISRGNDKTVIEFKLSTNAQCVHGLEVQIEEYAKAENTDKKIYVLINIGKDEYRISDVENKRIEMENNGQNPAKVFILDARPKESASKYNGK